MTRNLALAACAAMILSLSSVSAALGDPLRSIDESGFAHANASENPIENTASHVAQASTRNDQPRAHAHAHAHGPGGGVDRPDDHAPIGVMGEHVHDRGEWMLAYRYKRMEMAGNRDGTTDLTPADVRARGFMAVPTDMTMQMHMFGVMFAPTDDLTLMGMAPYIRKEMDHLAGMPLGAVEFTTKTEGFGDVKLTALQRLFDRDAHHLHLNFGVSFPTGSIDETDTTPAGGPGTVLPYPMQLGSGTFDLLPGLTYTYTRPRWSFGAQAQGTLRLGRNDADYSLGDALDATAWLAWKATDSLSLSTRLAGSVWGNVDGRDSRLALIVPTARPDLRGGERVDLLFGLNWIFADGPLESHRLAIEGGLPIYQSLDGPQLETDWTLTVGWQYAF